MTIIYFIDDKLGGVTSLCRNLVDCAPAESFPHTIIHIDRRESVMTRSRTDFPRSVNLHFSYSDNNNQYDVIRRLHGLLPAEPSLLILNYELEMAMLDHFEVPHTTCQLVHDDYNYELALKYEHVVDFFIAHNRYIYDKLLLSLPRRASSIYFLPHGVPIPDLVTRSERKNPVEPLKLFFLGRMTSLKGIFDLPEIDSLLCQRKVPVTWTCVGNGPDKARLQEIWKSECPVHFENPHLNEEVLKLAMANEVLVLPTWFEGTPVSLLETMSVGMVPLVSDLEGGIRDIVTTDLGFRIPIGDIKGFVDSIEKLFRNPKLLQDMGIRCRELVRARYAVKDTSLAYYDLFRSYRKHYTHKVIQKNKIGARLDQTWIPDWFTLFARKIL